MKNCTSKEPRLCYVIKNPQLSIIFFDKTQRLIVAPPKKSWECTRRMAGLKALWQLEKGLLLFAILLLQLLVERTVKLYFSGAVVTRQQQEKEDQISRCLSSSQIAAYMS